MTDTSDTDTTSTELFKLLEATSFAEVLWVRSHQCGANQGEDTLADLAAAIASQHLNLFGEATRYARSWSIKSGLHSDDGPLVSVIIPTYDRPETLSLALESVSRQLYASIEVIVVNDAGICVEKIIESYQPRLNLTLINNTENRYLATSRNIGARHAKGKWILFLDDDDQLYPHHVGHLVHLLTCNNVRAVQAHSLRHRESPRAPFRSTLVPHIRSPFELDNLLLENVTPVQAVLCETSLFSQLGGFDQSLFACEDWDLWIRVRQETPVVQSPIITSWIEDRETGPRMSTFNRAPFLLARSRIYNRYTYLLPTSPDSPHRLKQSLTLDTLATTLHSEMERSYSLELISPASFPKSPPPWLSHFQEPSRLSTVSENWLHSDLSLQELREVTLALLQSRCDYVAILAPDTQKVLPKDWAQTLLVHLAGNRCAVAAVPTSPLSSTPNLLRSGFSTDQYFTLPTWVMVRSSFLPYLQKYIETLFARVPLFTALKKAATESDRQIVAAFDVSLNPSPDSPTPRRLQYAAVPQANSSSPLLHITYTEELFTAPNLQLSAPLALQQHLSLYKESFNLIKANEFDSYSSDIDRRPGLLLEFEFSSDTVTQVLEPCLLHANLDPEMVTISPPGQGAILRCDLHLYASPESVTGLRKQLNETLEQHFSNRSFHPLTRSELTSAVIVASNSPSINPSPVNAAVERLRLTSPGIDLTLLANSTNAYAPIATNLGLRLLPTLDQWLSPHPGQTQLTDRQRLSEFFDLARELTSIHHHPLPTTAPVGLPKSIYQSLWWTSRSQSIIFLDFPEYGNSEETTAFFGACLLSTIAINNKVEFPKTTPRPPRADLQLLSEKVRGNHLIASTDKKSTSANISSTVLLKPTPIPSSPSATDPSLRVLLPVSESTFSKAPRPSNGTLIIVRPSPRRPGPETPRSPSPNSVNEFSEALYLLGALSPAEVNLTQLPEPQKSIWTSVCEFTATRVSQQEPS